MSLRGRTRSISGGTEICAVPGAATVSTMATTPYKAPVAITAQCRDDCQYAVSAFHGKDMAQRPDIDQADGCHKDQRAQRCLWKVAEDRSEEQQRQDHCQCRADGRHRTLGAGAIIDRGLRYAAPCWHATQK